MGLEKWKRASWVIHQTGRRLDFDTLKVKLHNALEITEEIKLGNEWATSLFAPGFSSPYRLSYDDARELSKDFDVFLCYKYWSYDPMAAHYRIFKKGHHPFTTKDEPHKKMRGRWIEYDDGK